MALPELDWELEDYLRAFWLHKWLILSATLLGGGFSTAAMARQPNIYRSTARVMIEAQQPKVVQFQEISPTYGGSWYQGFLQTEYRVISSRAVASRVVEEFHLNAFPPFSRAKDPVQMFQNMVKIEPIRGTMLVDIILTGPKPEFITQMVNAVADIYVRQNLERRLQETSGGIQWLKDEVSKMEQKVRASQLELQKFLEEHGTIDFGEEQQNTILQRLQALNAQISETRKDRIESEAKYREKHPNLLELQAKERELQFALGDQEQKALEMSRFSIQYNAILRDVKTNEGIYNTLLTRLKELTVQEGIQTNNVQVVDHAQLPDRPIGPPRGRIIILVTLLGFLLGCGVSFLLEMLVKTVRSRRDFEKLLEIPFLGHVPLIQLVRAHKGGESLALLTEPQSSAAEAIRTIRTTLEFLLPADQSHALLITSALPEEGKSFLSLSLAMALQELGRKTLLVDGDLRRPSLHKVLQVDLEPGLSGILQSELEAAEAVRLSSVANNLPVVPAGLTPEQPTDLLGSPKFRKLLQDWKQAYQYVIIDAPPVLVAADAAILSTVADGVLFLVRAGRTHGDASVAGKQRLLDVGAKLIGGILNAARLEMERGYRYYYYYHRGGKRYRRGKPAPPPAQETG